MSKAAKGLKQSYQILLDSLQCSNMKHVKITFLSGLLTSGGIAGVGLFRTKEQPSDAEQPFLQLLLFPFTFVIGREQNSAKANQLKLHMEPTVNITFL